VTRLILASQSAARRALLEAAGLDIEALPAAVDEAAIKESAQAEGMTPADAALMLADAKAARVARRHPGAVVIGADQLLVSGGEWFDKPEDVADARRQLLRLRGMRMTSSPPSWCGATASAPGTTWPCRAW
jgi:septum formation protein